MIALRVLTIQLLSRSRWSRTLRRSLQFSAFLLLALPVFAEECEPGPFTLCIEAGERVFEVEVDYWTSMAGGRSGRGEVEKLAPGTPAGLFTFFHRLNPEVLVKVLDGCAVNGHFWVLTAAATNVGFEVRVRDTTSGRQWVRGNVDLNPSISATDSRALQCWEVRH